MNSKSKIAIQEGPDAVAAAAAEAFARLAKEAAESGRPFRVALSGGSTPRLLYRLLASGAYRERVPWDRVHFFFGDERWVPPTHPDSNYKLAKDELFDKLSIDPAGVFPMPTEGIAPEGAAERYEKTLRDEFQPPVPVLDLILLGMGEDGHTASLFPHSPVLREETRLVTAPYVEKLATYRLTLTPVMLNSAAEVIFMVAGEGKASALKEVLEGEYKVEEYPSQVLRNARGRVTWLVDRAAASKLTSDHGR